MLPWCALPPLASDCHWPRVSSKRACTASTPRLCKACKSHPSIETSSWRVAYVHIPKTGGMSIGKALAAARAPACNVQTAGVPLCPCLCSPCFERSLAVAAECPSTTVAPRIENTAKEFPRNKWLWVAIVRTPRDWFFSAMSQWCRSTKAGRSSPRCRGNTTAADLVRAGWFNNPTTRFLRMERSKRRELLASDALDLSLRYFEAPNEQTAYLGKAFFRQQHYLVCSLWRITSVGRTLGAVLNSTLVVHHAHRTHSEPLIERWRESVRWDELRSRFYASDDTLYKRVAGAGGCLARTSSSWLRRTIDVAAAPVTWV